MTRVRYFDVSKGIAILAVVLSHSILIVNVFIPVGTMQLSLYKLAFTFHMPLFFILSGYFIKTDKAFPWARQSKQLLATYAITSLCIILINTFITSLTQPNDTKRVFSGWFAAAYYGAGDFSPLYLWPVPYRIGALWFLLALFEAQLLVYTIGNKKYAPQYFAIIFIIAYYSSSFVWFPLSIQSGMTASLFVYAGTLIRKYQIIERHIHNPLLWIVAIIIWISFFMTFTGFSMAMNQYGKLPIIALIGSFASTWCVLGFSMLIDRYCDSIAHSLSLVGKYSLAILCVHLLEDNTIQWQIVIPWLSHTIKGIPLGILIFITRIIIDLCMAFILFYIPKINVLFYPELQKKPIQ